MFHCKISRNYYLIEAILHWNFKRFGALFNRLIEIWIVHLKTAILAIFAARSNVLLFKKILSMIRCQTNKKHYTILLSNDKEIYLPYSLNLNQIMLVWVWHIKFAINPNFKIRLHSFLI